MSSCAFPSTPLSPSSPPLPHFFPMLGWLIQGFPICPRSPYPIQKCLFSREPHRAVGNKVMFLRAAVFQTAFLPFLTNLSVFSFLVICRHAFATPATLSLVSPASLATYFGFFFSSLGVVLPASSMQMNPVTLTMASLCLTFPQKHEDQSHNNYCFHGC